MADDVISLSRFRAELARAHRKRAEVLLADPKARQLIPTLPVQDLYYAIRELGFADAHELLQLASTEQVQGFLDIDGWHRDRMLPERLAPWLQTITELGPERVGKLVDRLEPETIHLYLLKRTRIYDLTLEEEPPEEPEGPLWPTPDGHYAIEFLAPGDDAAADQRLVDALYRYDLELAQKVIMGAKFDLESDLEETAYRFRSARMADLGYVPFDEAMQIYRPIALDGSDLASFGPTAPDDSERLPPVLLRSLDERLFLVRVLAEERVEAALERLQAELLLLLNHALSADAVDPADLKAIEPVFLRTVGYLGLGLEHLGQRAPAAALARWKQYGTQQVFRVGFSLVRRLANLARTLVVEGKVRLAAGVLLLDDPYRAVVEELLRPRPLCAQAAIGAAGEDGSGAPSGGRPFSSLAEVGRLAQILEEAALWPRLFAVGLGLPTEKIEEIAARYPETPLSYGVLLRTLVVRQLAGLPLQPGEAVPHAVLRSVATSLPASAETRARLLAELVNTTAERGLPELPLGRWLDAVLVDLPARLASGEGLLVDLGRAPRK